MSEPRVLTPEEQQHRYELQTLLTQANLSPQRFAQIVGVTHAGVDHWLQGRRPVNATVAKCVRIFFKYPGLLNEF